MFINWRGLRSVIVSSRVEVTQGSFFFTTIGVVEVEASAAATSDVVSETVWAVEGRTDFLPTGAFEEGGEGVR
jgi:hypothetical protein